MKETFSSAQVFGCSTAGEIVSGKVLKNSIVAMAFDEETISDIKPNNKNKRSSLS